MFEELVLENAHVNAQKVMTSNIYWANIGIEGPFGAYYGSHTFLEFKEWRSKNTNVYAVEFLKITGRQVFPLNEVSEVKVVEYLNGHSVEVGGFENQMKDAMKSISEMMQTEFSDKVFNQSFGSAKSKMGIIFLAEQDSTIISAGFSQFFLEGRIDGDLRLAVENAITRQSLDIILNELPKERRKEYRNYLKLISVDLKRIN